jgi:ATP-dependent Lhr-like helicase
VARAGADGLGRSGDPEHLVDDGYLETDGDLAFFWPEAERRFGRRHFSELMAVLSAAQECVVLAAR